MGVFPNEGDIDANGAEEVNLRDAAGTELVGQKASSASLPVVIASDQTAVPTSQPDLTGSGSISALNGTVVATVTGCSSLFLTVTGVWVGTLGFEAQAGDGTWVTVIGLLPTNTITTAISVNNSVNFAVGGYRQFRIRATAWTSGTATATWNASVGANTLQVTNFVASAFNATATQGPANTSANAWPIKLIDGGGVNVATVSAAGAVKTDGSAVTQPVSQILSTSATYGAQILGLTPAAATTDFFTITGSATKTVVVTKIRLGATTTLGSIKDIILVKRSTANSAGTSTTPVIVPFDSNDTAGTAVVRAYTANPTLGTTIGAFKAYKFQISAVGTANQDLQMEFDPTTSKGIILRGTSQVLSLSGNGVAFGGGASVDISIEWIEF